MAVAPLGFSQVLILKGLKVLCFHTLLQVLILKVVNLNRRTPFEASYLRRGHSSAVPLQGQAKARRSKIPCGTITERTPKRLQGYEDSALRYTERSAPRSSVSDVWGPRHVLLGFPK